jgi:hypothetical protein
MLCGRLCVLCVPLARCELVAGGVGKLGRGCGVDVPAGDEEAKRG